MDLTLDKLTCLARTLRDRRKQSDFSVFFFSSNTAAKFFQVPVEGYPAEWPKWAKELHAQYAFNAAEASEKLRLTPMGFNTAQSLVTEIDLSLRTPPRCKVEVQDRCLIAAMSQVTYPPDAGVRATGRVVLTGLINRFGRVTGVKVAESVASPSEERDHFIGTALRDLRSWQFDAAAKDDPLRITYSFALDAALPPGSIPQVRWVSPSQVMILTSGKPDM